jgi:hypothetical protein
MKQVEVDCKDIHYNAVRKHYSSTKLYPIDTAYVCKIKILISEDQKSLLEYCSHDSGPSPVECVGQQVHNGLA